MNSRNDRVARITREITDLLGMLEYQLPREEFLSLVERVAVDLEAKLLTIDVRPLKGAS